MIEVLGVGMVASSGAAIVACASAHRLVRAASEVVMLAAMLDCLLFGLVPGVVWAVALIAVAIGTAFAGRRHATAADGVHGLALVLAAGLVLVSGHAGAGGHHVLPSGALAIGGLVAAGVLVAAASGLAAGDRRDRWGARATTVGVACMALHLALSG